jgi:hypothetical protein
MNNKPIITLFEENEMNISALYSLYAQKVPEKNKFWERLSNEEIAHAVQIGNEKKHADEVVENKFSRSVMRYVMDFVLEEIEKAQQGDINHKKALRTALRIERSILEKKCLEMFTPKSDKIKKVFCKLNNDTERHVAVLLKEMKKSKLAFDDLER